MGYQYFSVTTATGTRRAYVEAPVLLLNTSPKVLP